MGMHSQPIKDESYIFSDPVREKKIGASLWLVIYCVCQFGKKGERLERIAKKLGELVEQICSKDKQFFLTWSPGYDLDDILKRYTELGILNEMIDGDGEPLWAVSEKGKCLLRERKKLAPPGISL